MTDFESFIGGEASEGFDPKAIERFKEQMRKNAAAMAALQKSEKKQKTSEDKLAKILAQFIKSCSQDDLVRLVSKCLERNMPAILILHVILLGNEHLQKEAGIDIKLLGAIGEGEKAIIPFSFENQALPLKLKIEIDAWVAEITRAAGTHSHKVLNTCIDRSDGKVKKELVKLFVKVLNDFLKSQQQAVEESVTSQFARFVLQGIMKKIHDDLKERKELSQR